MKSDRFVQRNEKGHCMIVFFPTEGEKPGEEKDKDKAKPEEAPSATDAKDKTEAPDVKKGTPHCPCRCRQ